MTSPAPRTGLYRALPLSGLAYAHHHPAWKDCPLSVTMNGERYALKAAAKDIYGNPYPAGTPVVFCFWKVFSIYDPPSESLACFYLDRGSWRNFLNEARAMFGKDVDDVWFHLPADSVTK